MAGCNCASERGIDCPATDRGMWVATAAAIHYSRPGSRHGHAFLRRLRAMGIRDRPITPRSPWQNGCAERLIGSIRRDCLDHVIVIGERHLCDLLKSYRKYYNEARTHLSLEKDAPIPAPSRVSVRRWPCQFWADCTINISERKVSDKDNAAARRPHQGADDDPSPSARQFRLLFNGLAAAELRRMFQR